MSYKYLIPLFILFLLVSISSVLADGFMLAYSDADMRGLYPEEQQFAAMSYQDGYQNMILQISLEGNVSDDQIVWFFPVPSSPENISIDVLKGFPQLLGDDVFEKADNHLGNVFTYSQLTQGYVLPFIVAKQAYSSINDGFGMNSFDSVGSVKRGVPDGVQVYESIQKYGMTTEVISTINRESFVNYLQVKNLTLVDEANQIVEEYIGEDYSFVISWISDFEEFHTGNDSDEYRGFGSYGRADFRNVLGVQIEFPTDELFFPLKPTSVYGDLRIPAAVYVLDYVTPVVYDDIAPQTYVEYYFEDVSLIDVDVRSLFTQYEDEYSSLQDMTTNGEMSFNDVKYTKIKIDSLASSYTQDLWIEMKTPRDVSVAHYIFTNSFQIYLFVMILFSMVSGILAGLIVFKGKNSIGKYALFGLWNVLTLYGLLIASHVSKFGLTQAEVQKKSVLPHKKFVFISLGISGLVTVFLSFFLEFFLYISVFSSTKVLLVFFILNLVLIKPFVWSFFVRRTNFNYIIIFSISFLIQSIIFEIVLDLMF